MIKIKSISFILITIFAFTLTTQVAFAKYTVLEKIPGVTSTDFPSYVTGIYKFALAIVLISALMMITLGGFYYITSAGNQAQAGTAKKLITDALLGLVVVFLIYLVLNKINPDLLNASPNLGALQDGIKQTSSSTVNKKNITKSSTNCRNIGGYKKCFSSKQACDQAVAPGAIATPCKGVQESFENGKYYYEDKNGKIREMKKADCEAATTSGGSCKSGAAMKGDKFASVQTVAQKKETLAEHNVTVSESVNLGETADKTILATANAGEPRCGGECEKKVIGTEGNNVIILEDGSGQLLDSKLINSIQAEAVEINEEVETLPGGSLLTKRIRRTRTYTYPEGHEQAGQTYQFVEEGIKSRGPGGWITGDASFARSSTKLYVFGEKDASPKNVESGENQNGTDTSSGTGGPAA